MGASLREAVLFAADLRMANLDGADLTRADLRGSCFRGARLNKAVLARADLREASLAHYDEQSALFVDRLPDLRTDFTLVGGRVTYLGQVPGAHLIYQIRRHQISVFIFPEDLVSLRGGPKSAKERSFNLQTFTQDGLRYIVFGDVATDDIKKLSSLLQSAAKSS